MMAMPRVAPNERTFQGIVLRVVQQALSDMLADPHMRECGIRGLRLAADGAYVQVSQGRDVAVEVRRAGEGEGET